MTSLDTPAGESPWSAGTVLGGRYRLLEPIGAGGMGEVWRASHVTLGTLLAVKVIDTAAQGDGGETLSRFLQEARAAAMLQSSNAVQILDHGHEGRIAYIAMELLVGQSLGARIAQRGALAPAFVARVVHEMARALTKAHGLGIVHRDLKPENVFLAQIEGQEVTKILDFGIAKILTAAPGSYHQTNANTVVGTPVYMSPEQVLGNRGIDSRSDLWQIAIIAFECLTGKLPFEADGLGSLYLQICSRPMPIPSAFGPVPRGFDAWFARAADRDPAARFQTAGELADALAIALDVSSIDLQTASGTAWSRPHPPGVALLVTGPSELGLAPPTDQSEAPPSKLMRRSFLIGAIASGSITVVGLSVAIALLLPHRGPSPSASTTPPTSIAAPAASTAPPQPSASVLVTPEPPPASATATPSVPASSSAPARPTRPPTHRKPDDELGI